MKNQNNTPSEKFKNLIETS